MTVFSQNSAVNNQLKDSANKAKKELDSVNKELGETVSAITELEKLDYPTPTRMAQEKNLPVEAKVFNHGCKAHKAAK